MEYRRVRRQFSFVSAVAPMPASANEAESRIDRGMRLSSEMCRSGAIVCASLRMIRSQTIEWRS